MIRLGSLAGYPFEGPRLLAGWTPPAIAAVYAITCKPDPARDHHAVIYVGSSADLTGERLPFKHPRAPSWIKRAGSKWQLYICTYEIPGGTAGHREQITRELISTYRPSCNAEQYSPTWKPEWIGEDSANPGGRHAPPPGTPDAGFPGLRNTVFCRTGVTVPNVTNFAWKPAAA